MSLEIKYVCLLIQGWTKIIYQYEVQLNNFDTHRALKSNF